jgi:hypothetical protein
MCGWIVTGMLLAGLALPAAVEAQGPAPGAETRLELEMKRRRHIVRPPAPPEQAHRDVEEATAALERPEREERLVRELTRPPHRRPDQDFDLRQGIQALGIQRALSR